jgi:hypothetical protein
MKDKSVPSEEFEKVPKIIHEIMKQDGRVSQ